MEHNEIVEEDLGDRGEFIYSSLSFLLHDNPNSPIPEICYFMSPDQIVTFIKVFEGRSIKVPTLKQFAESMHCALAGYLRISQGYTWPAIEKRLEGLSLNTRDFNRIKKKVEQWRIEQEENNAELPNFFK